MAVYRLRSEVIKAAREESDVLAFEELVDIVKHLSAYKVTLDALVVKGGLAELSFSGDLEREAIEHLNLEAV